MNVSEHRWRAEFDRQNVMAARIIAADPARYPGLLQQWARTVLARLAGSTGAGCAGVRQAPARLEGES